MKKRTYQEVKNVFAAEGYRLLDSVYVNGHEKMQVECPHGHIYKATFAKFNSVGRRCPYCDGQVVTLESAKAFYAVFGYTLLASEYVNAHKHMPTQCPEGHVYEVKYNVFQSGSRCPVCWENNRMGETSPFWITDRTQIIALKRALAKKYKLTKRRAVPQWAELNEIQELYKLAQELSIETSVVHHVDHIDPLTNDLICGLHCLLNLRVVPGAENLKKNNRFTPYKLNLGEYPSCPL